VTAGSVVQQISIGGTLCRVRVGGCLGGGQRISAAGALFQVRVGGCGGRGEDS
jgi:hypothetical protein